MPVNSKDNEMIFPLQKGGWGGMHGDGGNCRVSKAKYYNIFKGPGELSCTYCFFFFQNVKIMKLLCLHFWVKCLCNRNVHSASHYKSII